MDKADQEITVTYGENGVSLTSRTQIRRPEPETEPPTMPPTVPATEIPEPLPEASQSGGFSPWILILPGVLLFIPIFIRRRR